MTSHRETPYKIRGTWSLPVSEDEADNSIWLPLWVGLKEKDLENIVCILKRI
jgi:dTDP-4-amino-4,6-dideoxygalactose transaminase